jgi:hypothetical protein
MTTETKKPKANSDAADQVDVIVINDALTKISDNNVDPHELYIIAVAALANGGLTDQIHKFFSDVKASTRHHAILGCGGELNYQLLRKEASKLISL